MSYDNTNVDLYTESITTREQKWNAKRRNPFGKEIDNRHKSIASSYVNRKLDPPPNQYKNYERMWRPMFAIFHKVWSS